MLIFTIGFLISTILYLYSFNYLASVLIIALAIFLLHSEYKKNNRLNFLCLFYLGFLLPFGVSLLKLSNLSRTYSIKTFLVIFVTIFIFRFFSKSDVFDFIKANDIKQYNISDKNKNAMFYIELITIIVSLISFIIEIAKLKFLPILTINTPHAYSTFHIFGLHYLTVMAKFLPAMSVLLINFNDYRISDLFIKLDKYKIVIILGFVYPMILSILLVSRSMLVMSLIIMIITICITNADLKIKINKLYIALAAVIFVLLYIFITFNRAHSVSYLNDIFDMKIKLPIFITQPYIYLTQNFENLNYMIESLQKFTLGKRSLFALWSLTLIKQFFTLNIYTPIYLIKEELSTCTFLYDIYYDFGIIGVMVFTFILSKVYKYYDNLINYIKNNNILKFNPMYIIIYSLFLYYILFTFFQNYYILTNSIVDIIYLFIMFKFFDYYSNM